MDSELTFEQACELFYENEQIQEQFDYWEIDYAIATVITFINDIEEIMNEKE